MCSSIKYYQSTELFNPDAGSQKKGSVKVFTVC